MRLSYISRLKSSSSFQVLNNSFRKLNSRRKRERDVEVTQEDDVDDNYDNDYNYPKSVEEAMCLLCYTKLRNTLRGLGGCGGGGVRSLPLLQLVPLSATVAEVGGRFGDVPLQGPPLRWNKREKRNQLDWKKDEKKQKQNNKKDFPRSNDEQSDPFSAISFQFH